MLPPGNYGGLPLNANSLDQLPLYDGLMMSGIALGSVIGVASARMVRMTAMPQMVALFNGVGGGAAALIAAAEFHRLAPESGRLSGEHVVGILFSALVGSVSFWGSLGAFGKLQELLPGRPIVFPAQNAINAVLGVALAVLIILTATTENGIWRNDTATPLRVR